MICKIDLILSVAVCLDGIALIGLVLNTVPCHQCNATLR